jgi:GT2 family glycosyltransferase
MGYPKVFIIILNWNGLRDTLECLKSVYGLGYPNFEVIVVDNDSEGNPCEAINQRFPKAKLIRNRTNLGFAGGSNTGIRYAIKDCDTQYVWLLNNDTVVDTSALEHLVNVAETDESIGMVGSKIYFYNSDKTIWYAGGKVNWRNGINHHIGWGEKDVGQYDSIREVESLTGCSMLVKKAVYEKIGLMDEKFFLYAEELESCLRAQKYGFKCMFAPLSIVHHKVGASTKDNWSSIFSYYNTRNILQIVRKHFPLPRRSFYILTIVASKIWSIRKDIIKYLIVGLTGTKRYSYDLSTIYGIYHFLLEKMGKVDFTKILDFRNKVTV